jgi:hypothetical protein
LFLLKRTGACHEKIVPDGSYRIEHYRRTCYFAPCDKEGMIAVTTYRKGANAVKDRLEAQDKRIKELQTRFNEQASAYVVWSPFGTVLTPSRNGGPSPHTERKPLWFPL